MGNRTRTPEPGDAPPVADFDPMRGRENRVDLAKPLNRDQLVKWIEQARTFALTTAEEAFLVNLETLTNAPEPFKPTIAQWNRAARLAEGYTK